jgi:hypothetical protein
MAYSIPLLMMLAGISQSAWTESSKRGGADYNQTWCASTERIYFSCLIGRKTVSLCGADRITKTEGYLQYRFGRLGKEAELVYPLAQVHPRVGFRDYMDLGAQSRLYEISFEHGEFEYTLFDDYAAQVPTYGAGIFVGKTGGTLRMLGCTGKMRADITQIFRMYDEKVLVRQTGDAAKSRFMLQNNQRELLKFFK